MTVPVEDVVRRRREQRDRLIDRARTFVRALPEEVDVRAAIVFGSVARGDFNRWSDVDVLVIVEDLPERLLDRLDVLGRPPPRVQPVPWTPDEFRRRRERSDPIVEEVETAGVWLTGSPDVLTA